MLDDETFIRAILDNPKEEANWLAYADWLEEKGDPRAALYRRRLLTDSHGFAFVLVPRGTFWMGGGRAQPPEKQVEIDHEFYLGAYPVTQGQWTAVMGKNPSCFSRQGADWEKVEKMNIPDADLEWFPVEGVSGFDIHKFLQKLNEREPPVPCWRYGLPSVEEWDYACRGAARSKEECSFDFYLDRPTNDLSAGQANFRCRYPAGKGRKGKPLGRPSKVGSYPPNRLGLHDMHGNVREWTATPGGFGLETRGGDYLSSGVECRVAKDYGLDAKFRMANIGFRLCLGPSKAATAYFTRS
jgi:uncharacterized protein (TIGR02996 family)